MRSLLEVALILGNFTVVEELGQQLLRCAHITSSIVCAAVHLLLLLLCVRVEAWHCLFGLLMLLHCLHIVD